jgi:hypothetical protein
MINGCGYKLQVPTERRMEKQRKGLTPALLALEKALNMIYRYFHAYG